MSARFLTVTECAEVLNVHHDTIYHLTDTGEIPCVRIGRRKMIPAAVVDQMEAAAMEGFQPARVLRSLASVSEGAA